MNTLEHLQANLWPSSRIRRDISSAQLARAMRSGDLVRVIHGWYTLGTIWSALSASERHAYRVAAATRRLRESGGVVSHVSAAVLWGLPVTRASLDMIHLTDRRSRGGGPPEILRHELELDSADVVEDTYGRVTSLERTVLDIARSESRECAQSVADAVLRRVAWNESTRDYDATAADSWREEMLGRVSRIATYAGARRASETIERSDGRAASPGESISRLYLEDIGFRHIRLQVPVQTARRKYEVDFALDDVGVWGEFDGRGKYLDERLTGGRDARAVLDAEKMREDDIRAATGRVFVRWQWEDIRDAQTLASFLGARGVRPRGGARTSLAPNPTVQPARFGSTRVTFTAG